MQILILGGDGYLGWPTAMYLSRRGHEVTVADNYFRRQSCVDLDLGMLYPLPTLPERAALWHRLTGKEIKVVLGDLCRAEQMRALFSGDCRYDWAVEHRFSGRPETIIHFAEQPSAPYSLISYQHANTTLSNNLLVTNNLMYAVKDFSPQSHIVKLGTMGEYGTPNIPIEEGWITIRHEGRKDRFLFPRQGSSIYHTSKIMDTDLLWFGVRTWGLAVTDLMQGPVYGAITEETSLDEGLQTIFNYDEVFGTIINRFIVQAVAAYPLTVYGQGGQTRGYINLQDSLQCIDLARQHPAGPGELRIFNQITETFSVNQLAELTRQAGAERGYAVTIDHLTNPRTEMEHHYYQPKYQGLRELGVQPHLLDIPAMAEMFSLVEKYRHNIRTDVIFRGIKW